MKFFSQFAFVLLFGLSAWQLEAQPDENLTFINIEAKVTRYVNEQMEKWTKRGEFEPTDEYKARIQKSDEQVEIFTQQAIDRFQKDFVSRIDFTKYQVGEYDADSETFKIAIDQTYEIILPVPLKNNEAQNFKANQRYLRLSNPKFAIVDNSWFLTNIDVWCNTFVYKFDASKNANYDPEDAFRVDWQETTITLKEQGSAARPATAQREKNEDLDKGFDVDAKLPSTNKKRPNDIAIVVGNMMYKNTAAWVDYAINDARIVSTYLIEVLGFAPENVILLENATKTELETYFGTNSNHKGRLYDLVNPRESNVFVFYSGHGAPGRNDGSPYLLPIDGYPSRVELSGYSVETLYDNLGKLDVLSITVVMDACFSGQKIPEVQDGLSGVRIKGQKSDHSNTIILASSQANQYSCWYDAKKHGLFTFLFLKAIKNHEAADVNKDGKLTYQEVFDYVEQDNGGVYRYARRLHSNDQNPVLDGGLDPNTVFIDFN